MDLRYPRARRALSATAIFMAVFTGPAAAETELVSFEVRLPETEAPDFGDLTVSAGGVTVTDESLESATAVHGSISGRALASPPEVTAESGGCATDGSVSTSEASVHADLEGTISVGGSAVTVPHSSATVSAAEITAGRSVCSTEPPSPGGDEGPSEDGDGRPPRGGREGTGRPDGRGCNQQDCDDPDRRRRDGQVRNASVPT